VRDREFAGRIWRFSICSVSNLANDVLNLQLNIKYDAGALRIRFCLDDAAQLHLAIADSSKAASLELSPTILTLQLSLVQKNTCVIPCLVAAYAIL